MSGKRTQKRTSTKAKAKGTKTKVMIPKVKRTMTSYNPGNVMKVKRTELFATLPVVGGTVKKGHIAFNINNYPPWLKRLTTLYEMISFERIKLHIISNYATTTTGSYFIGFNSSYSDTINDSTLTSAEIMQQKNAKTTNVYTNSHILIPRTTFQLPYKRYLCDPSSTDSDALEKTWFFDMLYYIDTSTSGNFTIMIEYEATLYTPAIRA